MSRPPSDIAPRILRGARRRFLDEGVDGASLRAIASDAGTSIGMVYYYFRTKDELFLAVVEQVYVALLDDLESSLDRKLPVDERIGRLYRRLGVLSVEEKDVLRLIIRESFVSPIRLERLIRRFQRGHIPLLLNLVRDGLSSGFFRTDLPISVLLAALVAIAGPGQIVLTVIKERLPKMPTACVSEPAEVLLDVLLRGVAARKKSRRATVTPKIAEKD